LAIVLSVFRNTDPDFTLLDVFLTFLDVFNDLIYCAFSNISAISWQPVLVVEESGVPGENHQPWVGNCHLRARVAQ
jgi:hypothetical protein